MLPLIVSLFIVGCATSNDINTIMLINERLRTLETKMLIIESTKTNSQPNNINDIIKIMEFARPQTTTTKVVTNTVTQTITNRIYERTITIENSNGSNQTLKFELKNGIWYGPKGETYNSMPKQKDVERMYKL